MQISRYRICLISQLIHTILSLSESLGGPFKDYLTYDIYSTRREVPLMKCAIASEIHDSFECTTGALYLYTKWN